MRKYKEIIYNKKNNVATVTLNRPKYLNSLTRKLLSELEDAMAVVQTDPAVKVVVIRGSGPAFCTGAYLEEVLPVIRERTQIIEMVRRFGRGIGSIRNCGKPSVAAIHGFCTAGGFEIMIACDFAIATEDSRIGDFHMQRSIMGGAGIIPMLSHMVGARKAKDILLTGRLLSGKEAYELGLLNRLAPAGKLDETLGEFLSLLTESTIAGLTHVKFAIEGALADLTSSFAIEALTCASLLSSREAEEGIAAFITKTKPKYPRGNNWVLSHGSY